MRRVHADLEGRRFVRPAGVESAHICRDSGLLATTGCTRRNRAYMEVFTRGNVPTSQCHVHGGVISNRPEIALNGDRTITLTVGDRYVELRSNGSR